MSPQVDHAGSGLIGRSESWLSQVERGIRSVDRLSVLLDIARIVHVDVESLTGRPWQLAPNGAAVAQGLDTVRQVMIRYDHLLGAQAPVLPPLPDLHAQVVTLHQDYQAARYETVVRQLPDLITLIDGVPRIAVDQRRETLCTYVSAYVGAAKLLTKLRVTDLAVVAADRAATIAVEADSLGAQGMAAYQVVCALLRQDHTDEAELLAVRMAETIHRSVTAQTPTLASVAGALWLIAAVAAARRTDRSEAWARLSVLLDCSARTPTTPGPRSARRTSGSTGCRSQPSRETQGKRCGLPRMLIRPGWRRVCEAAAGGSTWIWPGHRRSASATRRRHCICWKRNAARPK